MNTKLTTTGHLAIAGSIMTLVTVVLPRFLEALMPSSLGSLLVSKQVQVQWLHSVLEAMN